MMIAHMNAPDPDSNLEISPEEDARLPIYESMIEREWFKWRPSYVRQLKAGGTFKREVRATALQCVLVLQQYQKRGLGADMGREAAHSLIVPEPE